LGLQYQKIHFLTKSDDWEEAFNLIVKQIQLVSKTTGVDGICMYGSGQFQTEDYYVAQKLLIWQLPSRAISANVGKTVWEMIMGLENGDVGLLWIAGTNPAVSMPDLERTKQALLKSPFTIYQDAYYPTETAYYAHLVLPATQWSEKAGTMTNSERVVTYSPAFSSSAPSQAKADWEIFAEVGKRLGFEQYFSFKDSAQADQEFVKTTRDRPCDMSGLSHELLAKYGPIQWPFPL